MKNFLNRLGLSILPLLVNILIGTLRIKIYNPPDKNSNYVFVFWHSQMLIGWWLFKDKKAAALVSQSKDGDILNKLLKKWKYQVVRGSSSKDGKEAIQELIKLINGDHSAVITPDGPRGPVKEMKNGIFIISNKSKIPIIPVKIIYLKKKVLNKSWDKFEIPLPFSQCNVYFGEKYFYEKYLTDDELNDFKKNISKEM